MSDAATVREAAENEWWSEWRAEDYSWRGLAKKPLYGWYFADGVIVDAKSAAEGAVQATLQHYWWDQKDRLVSGDGEEWTVAHVPMHWRDGSPAKAGWSDVQRSELRTLIQERVKSSSEGVEADGSRAVSGLAVQLRGCVLRSPIDLSRARILADQAFFATAQMNVRMASGSSFRRAMFKSSFSIRSVAGDSSLSFARARMMDDFDITGASVPGGIDLDLIVFFGNVSVSDAKFGAQLMCQNSVFKKSTTFVRVTVEGNTSFEKGEFEGPATFAWSKFHDLARWEGCRFKGKADFQRSDFLGVFSAYEAKFSRGVMFLHTLFAKRARFTRVDLQAQTGDQINFACARFNDLADFAEVTFPSEHEKFSGAFAGALFERLADFQTRSATWVAALDGAMLVGKLMFDPPDEIAANREFHGPMMRGVEAAVKADVEAKKTEASSSGDKPKRQDIRLWQAEARERRLKQLEGGCRVVKLAMGRDRNEMLEQRYYRFQLIARRRQKKTPGWEKMFSHLYALTSDYGTSMVKPFAALAFSLLLFTAGYLSLGLVLDRAVSSAAVGSVVNDAWAAASFSWNNTFRPLSALSLDVVQRGDGSWLAAMLHEFGPGPGFGVRALATVQSLLAIILAFLFALAVRRRFQIG